MHITILTIGSRGDVQPFLALGVGLQQAGYQVRLATHANFETMIRDRGLEFAVIDGNPQEFIQSEAGQAMMKTRNPIEFNRRFRAVLDPIMDSAQIDSWNACRGTDAIVVGGIAFWGLDIAERLNVLCCFAVLQPVSPTGAFPPATAPPATERFGGLYNRLAHSIVNGLLWQLFRPAIEQFRQSVLHLPPAKTPLLPRMRQRKIPLLNAVSPSVVPVPSDWTDLDYMTGYWFLNRPADFQPPADLVKFLASGAPPVYIGFGSMGGEEADRPTQIALAALEKTGQRGILLTGWSGSDALPLSDTVFKIDSIPHDWLFPQMACIVHHGGAGTSAATFRSGVPGIVIPFLADQPFWGYRASKLGVSPGAIDRKNLTVETLAAAISEAVNNMEMRDRAVQLGKQIQLEKGVDRAVEIIQKAIDSFR